MRDEMTRRGTVSLLIGAALIGVVLAAGPGAAADPDRRLIDAVRTQDAAQVRALLDRRADVNARSDDGSTALLWAAHWNDVAVADAAPSCRRRRERRQPVRHDAPVARLHQRQRAARRTCC